ncbi:MAG: molybdopterin-dependent oxidoreductase [Oceanococcus sp.]
MSKHFRVCNLCEAMCGIAINVEDGEIQSIKGDPDDPFSRGHICPKAVALKDLYEDPERIRTPLEKRAGQWHEISWDDALDKAAAGLKKVQAEHGNDALASYLGNPNAHNTGSLLFGPPLLRALKTRNKFSATSVDQMPHHMVAWKLYGHQLRIPVPDIDHCDHFVILGGNPLASNGSIMTVPDVKKRLKAVRQRGQVVVIDPRRSETAQAASTHHFIRPGTDVVLLLAMIHVLYQDELINPSHLEQFLDTPAEQLRNHFEQWTPERASAHCGLSADSIRQLVHEFCQADAPVLYGRMGVSVQAFGTLCQYLISLFNILTGRLDRPGGLMFTRPAANILKQSGPGHFGKYKSRVRGLPEFGGELPVAALAEEMLTPGEGQIRAMLMMAGNPVISTPNGAQLDRALGQLDFMVSIDFYINESNRHADIILPPVSPLEREHYDLVFHLFAVRNTARYAAALFDKPKTAKHDWEILQGLQQRIAPARGLKQKIGSKLGASFGPAGVLDLLLRTGPWSGSLNPSKGLSLSKLKKNPHGIDLGALQPELPKALHHRDQKIHLSAGFFLADIARVDAKFTETETANGSKMLLIGRRHIRSNNSWLHNSQRLVKGKSRCTALIHPEDAVRLGQKKPEDALHLQVNSRVGEVRIEAEISDEVMPGVISIPHGWGHDKSDTSWTTAQSKAGVNVNELTDHLAIDEFSGNAALNGLPVEVKMVAA